MNAILKVFEIFVRVSSRLLYHLQEKVLRQEHSTSEGNSVMSASIVITTHSRRFFSGAIPLIRSLRGAEFLSGVPIYLVVNADTFGDFDPVLRTRFLRECSQWDSVFPVCLGEPAGMSELWNTGIRLAGTQKVIVLSDDLVVLPDSLEKLFAQLFEELDQQGLVVLNHSWGHFGITQEVVSRVGWFDARLLGFGEEDGDYALRFTNAYGTQPKSVEIPGLYNVSSEVGFEEITKGTGKYSLFNREFFNLKYSSNHSGQFGESGVLDPIVGEAPRDPYWDFKREQGHLLNETDQTKIRQALTAYFSQLGN